MVVVVVELLWWLAGITTEKRSCVLLMFSNYEYPSGREMNGEKAGEIMVRWR